MQPSLPPLAWMPVLETGVPEIDADHRSFIDQYDTLRAAVAERAPRAAVHATVKQMLEHCLVHFGREEAVPLRLRFPSYEAHVREHRRFPRNSRRCRIALRTRMRRHT